MIYTSADLRAWRARERLTQAQVAELFGVAQRTVASWEAGHVPRIFSDRFAAVLDEFYREEKAHADQR